MSNPGLVEKHAAALVEPEVSVDQDPSPDLRYEDDPIDILENTSVEICEKMKEPSENVMEEKPIHINEEKESDEPKNEPSKEEDIKKPAEVNLMNILKQAPKIHKTRKKTAKPQLRVTNSNRNVTHKSGEPSVAPSGSLVRKCASKDIRSYFSNKTDRRREGCILRGKVNVEEGL